MFQRGGQVATHRQNWSLDGQGPLQTPPPALLLALVLVASGTPEPATIDSMRRHGHGDSFSSAPLLPPAAGTAPDAGPSGSGLGAASLAAGVEPPPEVVDATKAMLGMIAVKCRPPCTGWRRGGATGDAERGGRVVATGPGLCAWASVPLLPFAPLKCLTGPVLALEDGSPTSAAALHATLASCSPLSPSPSISSSLGGPSAAVAAASGSGDAWKRDATMCERLLPTSVLLEALTAEDAATATAPSPRRGRV